MKSVVTVSISFIALFIGLKMKSSMAAIITSLLLVLLTQANIGDFLLAGNLVFPVILTVISLLFTAWEPLIVTIRSDIPSFASQKSPLTPASCSHGMRNKCTFLTRE